LFDCADSFAPGKQNAKRLLIFGWLYVLENQTSSYLEEPKLYISNSFGTNDFFFY
jgi:hypothetical protein